MYSIQPKGFLPTMSVDRRDPHVLTMYRATHQHPGSRARGVSSAQPITVHQALTYLIYHYIERPIKRAARRIANSGHWSY
jgi:hypothetical protein